MRSVVDGNAAGPTMSENVGGILCVHVCAMACSQSACSVRDVLGDVHRCDKFMNAISTEYLGADQLALGSALSVQSRTLFNPPIDCTGAHRTDVHHARLLAPRTARRAARRGLAGRETAHDGVMAVRGAAAEALDTASRMDDTRGRCRPQRHRTRSRRQRPRPS
jgi:hypothetical protein